jgi:hypothetical protein
MRLFELEQRLKENNIVNQYINYIKSDMQETLDRRFQMIGLPMRDNTIYTEKDFVENKKYYNSLLKEIRKETLINLDKAKNYINNLTKILNIKNVEIVPSYFIDNRKYPYKQVDYNSINSFKVILGKMDFMLFYNEETNAYEIDDILEDEEDFDDNSFEYFNLVKAIQNPNFLKEQDKIIIVYTARPKKDRNLYLNDKVPNGIYVTTKLSEAEGYAMDFSDRDIYKIWIKKKYLVITLNGTHKNYKLISDSSFVPIEKIEMLN